MFVEGLYRKTQNTDALHSPLCQSTRVIQGSKIKTDTEFPLIEPAASIKYLVLEVRFYQKAASIQKARFLLKRKARYKASS